MSRREPRWTLAAEQRWPPNRSIFWPALSSTAPENSLNHPAADREADTSRRVPPRPVTSANPSVSLRSHKGSKGGARSRPLPHNPIPKMSTTLAKSRGAERYREDAAHYRRRADQTDDPQLRDAYFGLAMEYERLADVLEGKNPPPPPPRDRRSD
jgi:hypothetical protein